MLQIKWHEESALENSLTLALHFPFISPQRLLLLFDHGPTTDCCLRNLFVEKSVSSEKGHCKAIKEGREQNEFAFTARCPE
jgi:hypothetical protein